MKKQVVLVLVFAFVALLVAGCAPSTSGSVSGASAKVFKFTLSANESSAWYNGAAKFAELVKQRTNGKYAISVFPNGSLASGDQVKEVQMMIDGAIDFGYIAANRLETSDPRFQAIALPWLFANNADVDQKFLNGPMGQELLRAAESKGLYGLAWSENGFRQITNSKREIKSPDDVKGLKMRVASGNVFAATFKALGATTGSANLADLYNALRDSAFDGQDNSVDIAVANKFYDVQRYLTNWNYSYSALFLGASKKTWDGLDADTQKIFRQAAVDASTFQVQENRKATTSLVQQMKDKGVKVTDLTPEQVAAFRASTESVYTEFEPAIGKDFMSKYVTGSR